VPYEPRHRSGAEPDDTPPDGFSAVGQESQASRHRSRMRRYAPGAIAGLLVLGGLIAGLVLTSAGPSPITPAAARPHPQRPVVSGSAFPTTTAHLLERFEYVGPSNSGGFAVPSSSVASYYMYKCPGHRPNGFYVAMTNASGSDKQTIAKTAGHIGTGSAVLHPRFPGSAYHLTIRTDCVYRIRVYGS
jgi:hypothetical protein